jgi:hypothetical protein
MAWLQNNQWLPLSFSSALVFSEALLYFQTVRRQGGFYASVF